MRTPGTGRRAALSCALLLAAIGIAGPKPASAAARARSAADTVRDRQAVSAGQTPLDEKQARREKSDKLITEATLAPTLKERRKLLQQAIDVDPTNTAAADRLKEANQEIDAQEQKRADDRRKQIELQQRQADVQRRVTEAQTAFSTVVATGNVAAARDVQGRLNDILRLDPGNRTATDLQSQVTAWIRLRDTARTVRYTVVAILALGGGIFAFFKLRPRKAMLEMVGGPQTGDVFKLQKRLTLVGTMRQQVDWAIEDPTHKISRRHCEIARKGRRYFVTDCSLNGTDVNGVLLAKGQTLPLQAGDVISLSEQVAIRFHAK